MLNAAFAAAGEPIFGVYPPLAVGNLLIPNPTANLVSNRKDRGFLRCFLFEESSIFIMCDVNFLTERR